MAKLESMYRNKLYLKEVQSLEKKNAASNVCCRPTWEKSCYQPLNLHRSFSDSELSDPFGSSGSDGSDRELAFEENGSKTGSSAFAKEQIDKMWDGFCVKDYTPHTTHSLPSSPVFRMTQKKRKAWSPKVTVPKPFQMTIREARKKEQNLKSKSQIEMENNLLKKQLEEEAECQKKFRANPVPAAVFLPLYHDILQRNEERRRSVKERSKLRLLASQKPFQFLERERQRNEMRKMQLRDLSVPEKKQLFKAKPVPKGVYSPAVDDKRKEEELYREIRIRMRAEELLQNSSLPSSRLALAGTHQKKKQKHTDPKEAEHKPKIKPSVPDFELLHQRFQKRLLQHKQRKHLTVCQPFQLRTTRIPSNKGKILKDIEEDEEKLRETRWPYASPRCKPQLRHSSANSHLSGGGEPKSPRSTESTRQRLLAIRNYEKQRMQEYLQELQEMEERVKQRPLLFERVTQKNARLAAEKHYSNRLRALGICPEFVSKKGQTTKLLQCSRAEDFSDSPDARERVLEDRVKERESFEEAAASRPHSKLSWEEQEEEGEKKTSVQTSTQDGQSSELEDEDEEEAGASPGAHQPHHAEEAGSSPSSEQHHGEEEEDEEEAKAGLSLGQEEEEDDQSRASSQSEQSHEEEGQSEPETEGDCSYEDEEFESDDSEEKPSSAEAD
ncbi:F161A protein, partial [Alcedo cyanopectus]|nr:F161A protein [Ceyx cyanopectus]